MFKTSRIAWAGAILPTLVVAVACHASPLQAPNTTTFLELAEQFSRRAKLPARIVRMTIEDRVTASNLRQLARRVVEEMVFLRADGALKMIKASKGGLSPTEIDAKTQSFIESGLISLDDFVVSAEWRANDSRMFQTLATMDSMGKPKFEPILFFNGVEKLSAPTPKMGSWTWGPFTTTIENGFGSECVNVVWTVRVKCSADHCRIADPPPHIEITEAMSNCWTWEQKTTKGETDFCSDSKECRCSHPEV